MRRLRQHPKHLVRILLRANALLNQVVRVNRKVLHENNLVVLMNLLEQIHLRLDLELRVKPKRNSLRLFQIEQIFVPLHAPLIDELLEGLRPRRKVKLRHIVHGVNQVLMRRWVKVKLVNRRHRTSLVNQRIKQAQSSLRHSVRLVNTIAKHKQIALFSARKSRELVLPEDNPNQTRIHEHVKPSASIPRSHNVRKIITNPANTCLF